jgi:hypothetical protein
VSRVESSLMLIHVARWTDGRMTDAQIRAVLSVRSSPNSVQPIDNSRSPWSSSSRPLRPWQLSRLLPKLLP